MTVPRGRMEEEVKDAVQQLRQSHAMASADVARNADLEWCSSSYLQKVLRGSHQQQKMNS